MQIEVITGSSMGSGDAPDAVALGPHAALVLDPAGASAVLDMAGNFYGVSALGAALLKGALRFGREATARAAARRFGIPEERAAADLDRLIGDLSARGVLRRGDDAGTGRSDGGARIAAGLLAGIFRLTGSAALRARAALLFARLSFALFGWRPTIDAWRARFPEAEGARRVDPAEARAIDGAVRASAARNWMGADCKERALACFTMARAAGLPASLHIGVALYPLGGHCWARIGDIVVSDDAERCNRFLPVFRYA